MCTLIDEFKCDPNTKGSKGRIPLHYAAQNGHVDLVKKLVHDYGCYVMAKDDNGHTPLHLAAFEGSLSKVCTMIEKFISDNHLKNDDAMSIGPEAFTLLQNLKEIVKESLTCTFSELRRYISQNRVELSTEPLFLLCWAMELESCGYVLTLWNKTNPSDHYGR